MFIVYVSNLFGEGKIKQKCFLSVLLFALILVLYVNISSAAVIPSSEMGMADTNPNNMSTNDDNISSDNGNNISSDQENNSITSPKTTYNSNANTLVTSSEESDSSDNADISLIQ
jgi:hypothetical protein